MKHDYQQKIPYFISGPDTFAKATPKEIMDMALYAWQQGSTQLGALAKAYHFEYFHFLQPSQYVQASKIFTDVEKERAYRPGDSYNASVAAN